VCGGQKRGGALQCRRPTQLPIRCINRRARNIRAKQLLQRSSQRLVAHRVALAASSSDGAQRVSSITLVNVSLSVQERRKVALRGGLWLEERGAADALGTRLRMSLPPLEWRVMLWAGGERGAGCMLHSVFAGWLCCRLVYAYAAAASKHASTQRAAAGARLAAEQCPRDTNSAFRSMHVKSPMHSTLQ
jgi:hypothetical protein